MPGRGMGERLQVDPNDNRVLYFGAEQRQRPVAEHRLGRHLGQGRQLPQRGQLRAGPQRPRNVYLTQQPWRRVGRRSTRRAAPAARRRRRSTSAWPTRRTPSTGPTDAGATWARGRRPAHGLHRPQGRVRRRRPASSTSRRATPAARTTAATATCGGSALDDGAWTQISPARRPARTTTSGTAV